MKKLTKCFQTVESNIAISNLGGSGASEVLLINNILEIYLNNRA